MKIINIKKIVGYLVIIFIIVYIKSAYKSDVLNEVKISSYVLIITFQKNIFVNLIWFIPIFILIFIITKDLYYKITVFDVRYQNRNKYFNLCINKNIIMHITLSLINVLMQWSIALFVFRIPIDINEVSIIFIIKYIIELYLLDILILVIYFIIDNYIYSFLICLFTAFILLNFAKLYFIPFISLFVNYKINIITILLLIVLIKILKRKFIQKDLGGNEYDINY